MAAIAIFSPAHSPGRSLPRAPLGAGTHVHTGDGCLGGGGVARTEEKASRRHILFCPVCQHAGADVSHLGLHTSAPGTTTTGGGRQRGRAGH